MKVLSEHKLRRLYLLTLFGDPRPHTIALEDLTARIHRQFTRASLN